MKNTLDAALDIMIDELIEIGQVIEDMEARAVSHAADEEVERWDCQN